ncbi:MAG: AAA family ATPase [Blautia caecimuris]
MIIKRITVRNFGKLRDRTMEFSDGINVLYGDNESGKTTTHTFVRSMLYGIQRQRGRAARKDAYSLYLPWENSADYGGTLWFENGGKNFRLTRNFYKENPTTEFLCEDDGEILDVAQGDLDAVLGGISETVYENTVSVAQLKSTTGPELVREVQNYMASYQGAGDSSVDLGRTMQMLKMARKGYQVQAEQKKRENQREKEKISSGMEYIRQELEELQEKEARVSGQEKSFYIGGDGSGIGDLETGIAALYRKRKVLEFVITTALIFGIGGALAVAGITKSLITAMVIGVIGIAAGVGAYLVRLRVSEETEKKEWQKNRLLARQEKLSWSRENIREARKEKETALENAAAEYREAEEYVYFPLAEEMEIESLNLAMTVIDQISRDIHRQVGGKLRRRISGILSEITGGRYTEILMDADLHMTVNTGERTVPLESLSRGTVEQIYFSLRMAAGELLCGREQLPVFLDEVFGMYDEERLTSVLKWLAKEKRQVIICSCRQREMEILEKNGISYNKIVL